MKTIKICLLLLCFGCLVGCRKVDIANPLRGDRFSINATNSNLAETATPKVITQLNQQLERYNPQVKIIAPRQDRVFPSTDISVELEVENLPIFQDERLKLGNHLDLILDNEAAKSIYDVSQPVILKDLTPGTHTIRVFASRPWGESYKNEGAYAQTTFSVLTETNDNRPDRSLPLLTYGNPTGSYGAEPVLLDFYLTNAPLHSIAQNDPNLRDWKIKTTVNGDSFLVENWQPIYLTGLNQGKNWIQLELIDEAGNNIENTYNNTVRVINYDPQQSNTTISQLMADQVTLADAQPLIEQNYYIQPVGEPEIIEPKITEPNAKLEDVKSVSFDPVVEAIEEPTVEDNAETETSTLETRKSDNLDLKGEATLRDIPTAESTPIVVPVPVKEEKEEALKTAADSPTKTIREIKPAEETEITKSTEPEQIITITEESPNTSEPVTEIAIPESKSVEISGDKFAITIPQVDVDSDIASEIETKSPAWWKKILVRFRQKLESLVKLLPREV